MNPWPFVVAAYVLTVIGVAGLILWSYGAMRRAEAAADALTRK
ncbi:MAG: heme exporter protein CcmD [Sphingomicrobium sp.]